MNGVVRLLVGNQFVYMNMSKYGETETLQDKRDRYDKEEAENEDVIE